MRLPTSRRNHPIECRPSGGRRRRKISFPLLLYPIVLLCPDRMMVSSIGGGDGRSGRGRGSPPPPPPPPPTRRRSNPFVDEAVAKGDEDDWSRHRQYQPTTTSDLKDDGYADPSSSWYDAQTESQQQPQYWGLNDAEGDGDADPSRGWYDDGGASGYNTDPAMIGTPVAPYDGDSPHQDRYYNGNTYNDPRRQPPPPQQRPPILMDDPTASTTNSNRPPPPLPPAAATPKIPIHYEFPASKEALAAATKDGGTRDDGDEDEMGVALTGEGPPLAARASARRDLVTRYWSTRTGKAQIMASATLLGAALGNFFSKVRCWGCCQYVSQSFLWRDFVFRCASRRMRGNSFASPFGSDWKIRLLWVLHHYLSSIHLLRSPCTCCLRACRTRGTVAHPDRRDRDMGISLRLCVSGLYMVPNPPGGADTCSGVEHDAGPPTVLAHSEGLPDMEVHPRGGRMEEEREPARGRTSPPPLPPHAEPLAVLAPVSEGSRFQHGLRHRQHGLCGERLRGGAPHYPHLDGSPSGGVLLRLGLYMAEPPW
jgi:hypothetical protein